MGKTYNLRLDERELDILLNALVHSEWYDIIKPTAANECDDAIKLSFADLLEYGNAFLIKKEGLDENKDYKKLNCETHCKSIEKEGNDWINRFGLSDGEFLKYIRKVT